MQALWPFLAGAAVGWSIVYVYSHVRSSDWFGHDFRPERVLPAGVAIWFCTVTVGMILRYLFHEGVAFSFVIVATVTLGLFLLGITTESLPPLQDSWPILIIIIGLALILGTVIRKRPQRVDQQNQGVH